MIIGLSGVLAAGKDTVAEYLEEKRGFQHVSLSAILREMVGEMGLEINLENLTEVGNSLKEKDGPACLVEKAKRKADFDQDLVISSIRQPGEIERLRQERDFFMIFVSADPKVRFERLLKRNRSGDVTDFDEFLKLEAEQMDGKAGGMNLGKCREMSDYFLENNGTIVEFEDKREKTLDEIKAKIKNEQK